MFLVSGIIIGSAVRFHGRGMTGLFAVIAVLSYTGIGFLAFALDMAFTGTIWAMYLFILYLIGAISCVYISKIDVPFEEHRAHSFLTEANTHISTKRYRNKWYFAVPVLVAAMYVGGNVAAVSVLVLKEYQSTKRELDYQLSQRQKNEDKEIDVTPQGLESLNTKEILRYSYAYNSGLLFDANGRHFESFPKSEFKSRTILKYLVDYRDNARAKFILSRLNAKGSDSYLDQAVEQGDNYAKVYSSIRFGCFSNPIQARELLQKQRRIAMQQHIISEIDSILYIDFPSICTDLETPAFEMSYALHYSET